MATKPSRVQPSGLLTPVDLTPGGNEHPQPRAAALRRAGARSAGTGGLFRVIRYFSVTSFVCIVVAAVALAAFFRHVAIREIVEFGERSNVALAEALLATVRGDLLDFLARTNETDPAALAELALSASLQHEIDDVMRVKSVVRLKIYNQYGWVAYATRKASIGRNQSDNPGVISALSGIVASKLIYRDAFNAFDRQSEEDNLIQTYVPIRAAGGGHVRGVFELYTDVNPTVRHTEAAQWQIIGGAALVMTLLYLALLMVVRYAERIIRAQHDEIREHTATLERWSAHMLDTQEAEKKKIAFDLHEGVAQTLSAVKMSVESAARQLSAKAQGDAAALQPMVHAVKEAIKEVRSVALNLRPSSLDELGLVATIGWFCGEFTRLHPEIQAGHEVLIGEDDVPEPLKIIVYRVLEEACRALGRLPDITQVYVTLAGDGENIVLTIDHDWSRELAATDGADPALAAARERTVLSGGSFQAGSNARGGRTIRAAWLM